MRRPVLLWNAAHSRVPSLPRDSAVVHELNELRPCNRFTVPDGSSAFTPDKFGVCHNQVPKVGSVGVVDIQFDALALDLHRDGKILDRYLHLVALLKMGNAEDVAPISCDS